MRHPNSHTLEPGCIRCILRQLRNGAVGTFHVDDCSSKPYRLVHNCSGHKYRIAYCSGIPLTMGMVDQSWSLEINTGTERKRINSVHTVAGEKSRNLQCQKIEINFKIIFMSIIEIKNGSASFKCPPKLPKRWINKRRSNFNIL